MEGATYLNIDKCKDTEVMGVPTVAKLNFDTSGGRVNVARTGINVLAELLGGGNAGALLVRDRSVFRPRQHAKRVALVGGLFVGDLKQQL